MTAPLEERKARLRAELRARRRSMGDAARRDGARRLWAVVLEVLSDLGRLGPYRRVMAFHGFGDEPPTNALFAGVWAADSELVLPRVDRGAIVAVRHGPGEPLVRSSFGVAEPTGPPLDVSEVTTVVVPGLAFDRCGNRLGYGVGHYDRFLSTVRDDTLLVGACLHPQLVDELPTGDHDRPVDTVVTDEEVVVPRA